MIGDLYARKSTVDQGRSAARQQRQWEIDCARQGIQTGRVFVDPDLSASRYARKDRPDYEALIAYVREQNSELVCLWEASRGTRKLSEWVEFLDLCRSTKTLIRIFGEDPRTYDPCVQRDRNDLVRQGMEAESESERLSARIRDGVVDAANQGKPGGRLLWGYARRYDDRGNYIEQVPVPEQAAIIKQMAADTLAGVPLDQQARALNGAGVPTPTGSEWDGGNIRRMLLNRSYQGTRMHKGRVAFTGAWPPILDEITGARLRVLLTEPGRRKSQDQSLRYMLSGEPVCDECESKMRTAHRLYYSCTRRGCQKVAVRIVDLDRLVNSMVRTRLKWLQAGGQVAADSTDSRLDEAKSQLDTLRTRLASFYEAAATGTVSAAGLAQVESQIRPQISTAEDLVRRLSVPSPLAEYAGVDLVKNWAGLPVGMRRSVVHAMVRLRVVRVGRGGRWTPWRLHKSMWIGESQTWGEIWEREGKENPLAGRC